MNILELGRLATTGLIGAMLLLSPRVGLGSQLLFFVHTDHLNAPRLIADQNQTTVWRWDQGEPFGNNPSSEDPDGNSVLFHMPLRFPGQYLDKETNLRYNYFRDYDPGIGRYVQSDPIGLKGGVNTYFYVGGNPLRSTDPLGLEVVFQAPDQSQLQELQETYNRVRGTKRGRELCEPLEKAKERYTITVGPIGRWSPAGEGGGTIYVPLPLGPMVWTESGRIPASPERVLAHELGHAGTGMSDFGYPNNWQVNENPIMKELGQPPRVRYGPR